VVVVPMMVGIEIVGVMMVVGSGIIVIGVGKAVL
jgi:hypothetical protein